VEFTLTFAQQICKALLFMRVHMRVIFLLKYKIFSIKQWQMFMFPARGHCNRCFI